jgi:hypothetical protein
VATEILRPVAIGFYDQISLIAGATKPIAVDPLWPIAHDDITTYLRETAGGQYQSFTCTVPASLAGAKINSVTVYERSERWGDPGFVGLGLRLGGVDSALTYRDQTVGWSTRSPGVEIARPGGGSWTSADLTTLELIVRGTADPSAILEVTSLWAIVDYVPRSGGCAPLVI